MVKTTSNIQELNLSRTQPCNILAEQMLLGTILSNNEAFYKIGDFLKAEDFYEPLHQKIFRAVSYFLEKGMLANPVILKNYFENNDQQDGFNHAEYIIQITSLSTTIINIQDYAKKILDLAIRRHLINLGEEIVNDAYDLKVEVNAIEQIEFAEQKLFNLSNVGNQINSNLNHLKSSLKNALERIQVAFQKQENITGIGTGFVDLDKILCGLQNSDLLILAGRPSMGKTALAINLALNAAIHLKNLQPENQEMDKLPAVAFFSLEMSADQLATRMMAIISEVNSGKLRSGQINENDFVKLIKASKDLSLLPFFIDDTPSITISALRTRARRMKRKHNLSLLVVDYLQLLRGSQRNGEDSRVQEISEITQGLKAIAKELNIPVIALSQLSRAVEQREDKKPLLSDLRESGSIEQDADIVMFIYRDEYYLIRKQPKENTPEHDKWQNEMNKVMNIAEVIIAKQRNGPVGNIKLHFDSNITKFSNHAENYY